MILRFATKYWISLNFFYTGVFLCEFVSPDLNIPYPWVVVLGFFIRISCWFLGFSHKQISTLAGDIVAAVLRTSNASRNSVKRSKIVVICRCFCSCCCSRNLALLNGLANKVAVVGPFLYFGTQCLLYAADSFGPDN